ncbi:helix-turn-helix domain-containing protein [Streptomyces sp. NPDC049916]|uniref:helix-turn-helix domain-containing protein n=1 Tax=Streptomyces sp. NPDC049916 TaxID=3155156 RepID=UPI0034233775
MLRIHFTPEDLIRTRVAVTVGVAAETFHSLEMLRDAHGSPLLDVWRAAVARRVGPHTRPLTWLLPARGPGLDVLALMGDPPDLDHAVDNLLSTPLPRLHREFDGVDFRPAHAPWARRLRDGEREALLDFAAAARGWHQVAVEPFWNQGRSALVALSSRYAELVLQGGVDLLLRSLGVPGVRWCPPVLEAPSPRRTDVHLRGRGLDITPAVFSPDGVSFLWDPLDTGRPPKLIVPALREPLVPGGRTAPGGVPGPGLVSLLGRTRAAALLAATESRTTTELARRLGVSAAAASQHTRVLRDAGLITSTRRGGSVLHFITPLGTALLTEQRFNPGRD